MNWDAVTAIAEILGAVGVILSLLYLALQIRQNTRAQRLSSVQMSADISSHFTEMLAANADLNRIFWSGMRDPGSLDVESRQRFIAMLNALLRKEAAAFYLHQEKVLPEEIWASRVAALRGSINQPGLQFFLEMYGVTLPQQFRDHLRHIIMQESSLSKEARTALYGGD